MYQLARMLVGSGYAVDSNNVIIAPARQIADGTLIDTRGKSILSLHDQAAQSKLEVDGAVYFEHLNSCSASWPYYSGTAEDDDAITVTKARRRCRR